jgi:hypothetical protein
MFEQRFSQKFIPNLNIVINNFVRHQIICCWR